MSTGVVVAGAAAVALYAYLKGKGLQDENGEFIPPQEVVVGSEHAPNSWSEALFHVKEVIRYFFNETLGRWGTIDLFVGLAYLSHREAEVYPAADVAATGYPTVPPDMTFNEQLKLMLELQEARRYMLYCKGLKLRREDLQARFWKEHLGAETLSVVKQQPTAGVLRPAYVLVTDRSLCCVVLCIRGTQQMKDLFTSLAGTAKPHHVVDPDGTDPTGGHVVLGYSHLGMLAAARWLLKQVTPLLRLALAANPGYGLRVVGHSMGGGTAVLLTMMLREAAHPELRSARCTAIACPCLLTPELARCCAPFVTSIIHGTDVVPTFCSASVDRLREDVTRSSWFAEFSRDMRSGVLRALQGGVRGMGTATQWTSRNILAPAVGPFRACYTTTTRRRRRATALTAPLLDGSPSAAEQLEREQLLLAAGAGGGAASAAAAAAAAAMAEAGGPLSPTTAAAALAAMTRAGPGAGPGAPPPLPQEQPARGAALDERAMAEAVQSCMYAVGSSVQQQQHRGSRSEDGGDPTALTEALGLLDAVPPLSPAAPGAPGAAAARRRHSGGGVGPGLRGEALATPPAAALSPEGPGRGSWGGGWLGLGASPAREGPGGASPAPTQSAGTSGAAGWPAAGGGGVSTALSYGGSLRRRLWPWAAADAGGGAGAAPGCSSEQGAAPDGAAGGGGAGGEGPGDALGERGAAQAPGSPGKAKALRVPPGGGAGGGGDMAMRRTLTPASAAKGCSGGLAAAMGGGGVGCSGGVGGGGGAARQGGLLSGTGAVLGSWLSGGLFTACTAPRRSATAEAARLGGGGAGGAGLGQPGALRMDVGEGFDDESDDDDEEDEQSDLESSGTDEQDGSDSDELMDEQADTLGPEGAALRGASGRHSRSRGRRGSASEGSSSHHHHHLAGMADAEQQLQAGITAVVAAVTNQAAGDGSPADDETVRAAESVFAEVGSPPPLAAGLPLSVAGGSGSGSMSVAAGLDAAGQGAGGGGRGAAHGSAAGAAQGGAGQHRRKRHGGVGGGMMRGASDSVLSSAAEARSGAAGAGDADRAASGGSGGGGAGPSSAEPRSGGGGMSHTETLQYKRRLYPAGRILHLFPAAAIAHLPQQQAYVAAGGMRAAAAATQSGAAEAAANAAATNPVDAAAARSAACSQPYVLYEVPDPQAYCRIKLCRTMVSDHLIPAYLGGLESVLAQLEARQEEEARAAWAAQEERDAREEREAAARGEAVGREREQERGGELEAEW